jgi:charged multivesicular body protein 6
MLEIKSQRDALKRYIKKCSTVVDREIAVAKQLLRDGKRDKAKLCLQKKKFQEQLITRAEETLSNIEEMVNTLEFTEIEKKVFDSLKIGNATLKQLQKEMSIEAVEDLLLDTEEAIAHQKEIGDMLREKLTDDDEDEILKELETLTTESNPTEAPLDLPSVQKTPLQAQQGKKPSTTTASSSTKEPSKTRTLEAAQ